MPFALILLFALSPAEPRLPAAEARAHIGENATVGDVVIGVYYASRSKGQPHFLRFGQRGEFTAVIWIVDWKPFRYQIRKGNRYCVSGRIYAYRGNTQVRLSDRSQLKRE